MSKPVFDDNPLVSQHQALGNQSMQRFAQSCPLALPSASLCPFGGVCHTCPARVQTSLKISQPGDKYEQEADRVAEEVMRMPDPSVSEQLPVTGISSTPQIQRHCPECDEELQRQVEEEEEVLHTKEISGHTSEMNSDIEANINSLQSGGQPLPESIRNYFEPRFDYDFSRVRVHTDGRSAYTARSMNARAYTLGSDIIFGVQQFVPGTNEGQKLLAHELTHVIQQSHCSKQLLQRKKDVSLDIKFPESAKVLDPEYKYPWQNPHLRSTIYPYRNKELMDFLLIYKEIDLWKSVRAGEFDLSEITAELTEEQSRVKTLFSEAKSELSEAGQELRAHLRGRKAFFKNPDIIAAGRNKAMLEKKKKDLKKKINKLKSYLDWYRAKDPKHEIRLKKENELEVLMIELDETNSVLEKTKRIYKELVSPYTSEEAELEQRMKVAKEKYKFAESELKDVPKLSKRNKVSDYTVVKWELLKEKRRLEYLEHDALLQEVKKQFYEEPGRFPQWVQYMVIHFSGMRYQSAHGSWASPQELLKAFEREKLTGEIYGATEKEIAKQSETALASLIQQRKSTNDRKEIKKIDKQIADLSGPERIIEKAFISKLQQKEGFNRLQELENERDALTTEINTDGVMNTTKDLNRSKMERLEQIDLEISNIEKSLSKKSLKNIRERLGDAEQSRRKALLAFEIKQAISRIERLSDFEALGLLKSMHDQFPEWVWKEIVRRTQLRLEITSENWESQTAEEKQAMSKKDFATKRWNEIMRDWKKNITLWRQKNRSDLSLVVIRAVCNEVAEHAQHARGVAPAPGIELKTKWYQEQEEARPTASYFRRPTRPSDFQPGASIFWQIWAEKRNSVASPIPNEDYLTENGHKVEDRFFDSNEGWTYHYDTAKKQFIRTSTGVCPCSHTQPGDPDVKLTQRLWWKHEATVVEIGNMGGNNDVIITFETGAIGIRTRKLKPLLNQWNVFVGFIPAGNPPANLSEKLKKIVPEG